MITRGDNFDKFELDLVNGSTFGRYPKISESKTFNFFLSDGFLVPYGGYKKAIASSVFENATNGRALVPSTKFNRMIGVFGQNAYLINISFNQKYLTFSNIQVTKIGELFTNNGVVYISENNKPQILFSDSVSLYLYDPLLTPQFQAISTDFVPGFIDFQDTYFLCAATQDQNYIPPATNVWRLSASNDGTSWPADAQHVGLLQTKSDVTQAVIRVPSRGNMAYVMGKTVTEPWFNLGLQLFPYQRQTSLNFDYGCINPATIAYNDEYVVWLAQNEKSGPIIVYSTGDMVQPISTDGIDYLLSTFNHPEDSEAFLYRQDGHLFYHINFYSDNISLFYDFNTKKFCHACDENMNYFILNRVAFFNNQYYGISKNDGNLYAFDTAITTYDGKEIPRFRTCSNIRLPSQEYRIINDVGFTIETGETDYQQQDLGPVKMEYQDGTLMFGQQSSNFMKYQDDTFMAYQDGDAMDYQQEIDPITFNFEYQDNANTGYGKLSLPRVDFAISKDGGASFSSYKGYRLNPIGKRRNRLMWWQCGIGNDIVCQFKFWGLGRFVATDGVVNIRK